MTTTGRSTAVPRAANPSPAGVPSPTRRAALRSLALGLATAAGGLAATGLPALGSARQHTRRPVADGGDPGAEDAGRSRVVPGSGRRDRRDRRREAREDRRAPRAVRFEGTVVDWYYGLPLGPGAEVHVWSREDGSSPAAFVTSVRTRAGGTFSVRLPGGPRYQFRAFAASTYGRSSGWIRADRRRQRVDLVW